MAYGQKNGWQHVATVREAASGEDFLGREVCRALEMLEQQKVEILVVRRVDRLARSTSTFKAISDRVYSAGGSIAVADSGKTFTDPAELARSTLMQQLVAEQELALTRSRTSDGKLSALERGSMLQRARFGYSLQREWRNGVSVNVPVHDPVHAQVVRVIVKDYLSGLGSSHIARKLNAAGVPTPGASKIGWNPGQIHRILSWARHYAGEPAAHTYEIGQREQHLLFEYPAIVSVAEAESVASRLKRRRRGNKKFGNPLRGLIYCSDCGGRGSLQGPSYLCASKHREYIYRSTGMAAKVRSCRHTLSKQHILRRLREFLVVEQRVIGDRDVTAAVAALDDGNFKELHRILKRLSAEVWVEFDDPRHSSRKNSLKIELQRPE